MNGEKEEILKISNLTRTYGEVRALKQIDLTVREGEWLAIMGPSGSGKTTLLNIISGLEAPTSGSVLIDGVEISGLPEKELARYRREKVGLVFQQFHLIPYLSALENVMLAQYFHSIAAREEAEQALERVGLGHRLDHLPARLSGGEQQRVCIARALINEPQLLLADEPTGNLDEKNEKAVMQLFRDLHRQGMTLVVVTHDDSIGGAADSIVYLEHGRIAGGQADFEENPAGTPCVNAE